MRLALFRPFIKFLAGNHATYASAPAWSYQLLSPSLWVATTTRLPHLAPSVSRLRTELRLLDKGFFFPHTLPSTQPHASYKAFKLSTRGPSRSRPTFEFCYKALLWETLEGLKAPGTPLCLNANRQREEGGLKSTIAFAGAMPSTMYGGIRHTRYNNSSIAAARARKASLVFRNPGKVSSEGGVLQAVSPLSPLLVPLHFSKPLSQQERSQVSRYLPATEANMLKFGTSELPFRAAFVLRPKKLLRLKPKGLVHAISQTRYKPGLSKAWRLLRLQFCLSWGLPWLRQRRFTNYISQISSLTGLNFLRMCTSSVGGLAKSSGLAGDARSFTDLLFLNGTKVTNPLLQVYKGDRISVAKNVAGLRSRIRELTQVTSLLPLKGVEIDGLTRALTVIEDSSSEELKRITFAKPLPFLTFRMYNWKYRH